MVPFSYRIIYDILIINIAVMIFLQLFIEYFWGKDIKT